MLLKIEDKKGNESTLKLEDEQVLFLVEFAVVELMKRGVLSLEEGSDGITLQ